MLRFGIELVPNVEVKELIALVKLSESLNFSSVWITDHYNNRGAYSTLSALALSTSKIELGIGVTNPYTRNIAVIAGETAALSEISNGRAVLGIGAGDKATLASLGITQRSPLKAVEESVFALRGLLRKERVNFKGEFLNINAKLGFKPEKEIKIYIGAQGKKMLALASRIGDGILLNASNKKDVENAVETIKGAGGAEKELVVCTSVSVGEDREKAKKAALPIAMFITLGASDEILERHGISREKVEKMREYLGKGNFQDALNFVDETMLDAFCICGTKKEVKEKLEEIKAYASQIVFGSPLGHDKVEALRILGKIKDEISSSQP